MDFEQFKNSLTNQISLKVGIVLNEGQCHNFFDYMNVLIEKNKVMNLTAITEPDEIILRHFVDSSIPLKFYGKQLNDYKYIVDVGTGAGFPGIPMAILCPHSSFVLNDTLGKRVDFLSEVISIIRLRNVQLVKSRAEDFGRDKNYREKFDYAVSRGVSRISILSEYLLPLVKIGGSMISFKMDNCDAEVLDGGNAVKVLGGMFHVKHSYSIIDDEPKRCLLDFKKIKSTPNIYPRKPGMPSSKPL